MTASCGQIVRDRGWQALYRGNFLNVIRAAPQKALDFFAFEIYKVSYLPLQSMSICPLQDCMPAIGIHQIKDLVKKTRYRMPWARCRISMTYRL